MEFKVFFVYYYFSLSFLHEWRFSEFIQNCIDSELYRLRIFFPNHNFLHHTVYYLRIYHG